MTRVPQQPHNWSHLRPRDPLDDNDDNRYYITNIEDDRSIIYHDYPLVIIIFMNIYSIISHTREYLIQSIYVSKLKRPTGARYEQLDHELITTILKSSGDYHFLKVGSSKISELIFFVRAIG